MLCNLAKVYADKTDTIPPSYTWITPKEFSILTTNSIKLCVNVNDNTNGKRVKSVKFYAHYYDYTCTEIYKEFIGEVKDFPYEYLWDCSDIPDQCLDALILYCDVSDSLGNVSSFPQGKEEGYGLKIVLDRNPYFKDLQLLAHKKNKTIIIDGNLNEWAPKDSIFFSNNDDNIIVYSTWDKKIGRAHV